MPFIDTVDSILCSQPPKLIALINVNSVQKTYFLKAFACCLVGKLDKV